MCILFSPLCNGCECQLWPCGRSSGQKIGIRQRFHNPNNTPSFLSIKSKESLAIPRPSPICMIVAKRRCPCTPHSPSLSSSPPCRYYYFSPPGRTCIIRECSIFPSLNNIVQGHTICQKKELTKNMRQNVCPLSVCETARFWRKGIFLEGDYIVELPFPLLSSPKCD